MIVINFLSYVSYCSLPVVPYGLACVWFVTIEIYQLWVPLLVFIVTLIFKSNFVTANGVTVGLEWSWFNLSAVFADS